MSLRCCDVFWGDLGGRCLVEEESEAGSKERVVVIVR